MVTTGRKRHENRAYGQLRSTEDGCFYFRKPIRLPHTLYRHINYEPPAELRMWRTEYGYIERALFGVRAQAFFPNTARGHLLPGKFSGTLVLSLESPVRA